ncbi:glutamate-1-semialdehyde 2,1-aminomutase [Sphingobacterium nematocida]|uniref:Glutamate-1-semialdehyde 2,1-aminomutase n=1 Tax=Sphingobacterium nematocida TaxID=1513896 RepID=A0A1T5GTL1_9SPHI|nr:glutamate-1-semialdehyde 2,1-aminomutase [Sphingobacterium nematocida]SKC11714.1 glutamate-1-semialdehyde 2,1-aminomutase [Sphingobacterium nematocida]
MKKDRYENSRTLFLKAATVIPGGVNSPVRAFNSVGGNPVFVKKGKGAYLYDADDNTYIDYVNSWGALLFGHAFFPVVGSIQQQALLGTSYGIPTEAEIELARLFVDAVPHVEKVRFVNSGTEATMSAIRLARGFTGRSKIIKFVGCYHGHADSFLVAGGSGLSTLGIPDSAGVPQGAIADTLLADFNSLDSVALLFEQFPESIAAVIVEPVAGNMGCVAPSQGFLEGLRKLCSRYQALLIFDEVMTGFRLARGGAQEYFKVEADLVTFGKIVGGGLPVGAFAGKSHIMDQLAPLGPVYQAGTLSGNPLAMSAGIQMLKRINKDEALYRRIQHKTSYLEEGLKSVFEELQIQVCINSVGSMISLFFNSDVVTDYASAQGADAGIFRAFFHGMLEQGIYLPPSPFESWFLSDALTQEDLDYTIEAARTVLTGLIKNKITTASALSWTR